MREAAAGRRDRSPSPLDGQAAASPHQDCLEHGGGGSDAPIGG